MIHFFNRKTGELCTEKVYGEKWILLFYGKGFFSQIISSVLLPLLACAPLFSNLYSFFMKRPKSKEKIKPFIKKYQIDESEFATSQFDSFNDFFIRKLKASCRPIAADPMQLAAPADGRYFVYPKFDQFFVKNQEFCLRSFLQDRVLAHRFTEGSMLIARLCPVDYHRFHFPFDGIASKPRLINGHLYSVNPLALKKRIAILAENKRMITEVETKNFGVVLCVEIGATAVGSIKQTFTPEEMVYKGEEKGYFEFGGSCIVLLFEKNRIAFDTDLIKNTQKGYETLCHYGESIGYSLDPLSS